MQQQQHNKWRQSSNQSKPLFNEHTHFIRFHKCSHRFHTVCVLAPSLSIIVYCFLPLFRCCMYFSFVLLLFHFHSDIILITYRHAMPVGNAVVHMTFTQPPHMYIILTLTNNVDGIARYPTIISNLQKYTHEIVIIKTARPLQNILHTFYLKCACASMHLLYSDEKKHNNRRRTQKKMMDNWCNLFKFVLQHKKKIWHWLLAPICLILFSHYSNHEHDVYKQGHSTQKKRRENLMLLSSFAGKNRTKIKMNKKQLHSLWAK